MSTADDLANQIKQAESQKTDAKKRAAEHRAVLTKTIADLDKQIYSLKEMRSKAAADLSTLAG